MQDIIAEIKKYGELENHYFLLYERSGYSDKKILRQYRKVLKNYHKALHDLMLYESQLPDSKKVFGLGFESIKKFGEVRVDKAGEQYLILLRSLTLYHVTDARCAVSILKTGLKPRSPGKYKRFQDESGMPKGVYLTTRKGVQLFKKEVNDPAVFKVKLLKGMKLWIDSLTCRDYYTKVAITSSLIIRADL